MSLDGFDQLHRDADARQSPLPIVAAGGADRTVIEALGQARDRGWVAPVVVGDGAAIRDIAGAIGVDLHGFRVVEAEGADVAQAAVAEVRSGRAAMLVKGQVSTADLMRAVFEPETGLRLGKIIAQVVLMEIPRDDRRFLLADTGVMVRPNQAKKIEILRWSLGVANALGSAEPLVALMAASESPSAAMPETIEAAELQRRNRQGEFPGCLVQGPLSFDLAYAADAGDRKRIGGPVVGAADLMLFPDLASANLTVKAIMYTASCRFGGVLRGTSHPVAFMSRADDHPDSFELPGHGPETGRRRARRDPPPFGEAHQTQQDFGTSTIAASRSSIREHREHLIAVGTSSYVWPSSNRPALTLRTPPHCLKKKGTPADAALVSQGTRTQLPLQRSRAMTAFATDDCPTDSLPIERTEVFQQRLDRQEPQSGGSGSEMLDARETVLAILDADAPPDVFRGLGSKSQGRFQKVAHPLGTFGQHLIRMPVSAHHDFRHGDDVRVRHIPDEKGRSSS